MSLHTLAHRPHPCAPWLDLDPALARRMFPAGHAATSDILRAREEHLASWTPASGFPSLVARAAREHGPEAAVLLMRVRSGEPVVLTGQQPSFGGGPLFVWLKAWTAIVQAQRASRMLGRPVHALFWIAGDDSDLDESRSLSDPLLRRLHDPFALPHGPGRTPAGSLPFDLPRRDAIADTLAADWPSSGLPDLVRSSRNLSELMAASLRAWFGDRLIVVDAAWPEVRGMASSVYRTFAATPDGIHADLSAGMARARAAGLPVSLSSWPDKLRVFHMAGESRVRITRSAGGWEAGPASWNDRDLLSAIEDNPQEFSHDVASRPYAAEAAFPVLAHVLGPGEFAYFACLGPLGSRLQAPLAPVLPRASATILPQGPWPLAREAGWDPAFASLAHTLLAGRLPRSGLWPKLWADARADYLGILSAGEPSSALEALNLRLAAFEARYMRSRVGASAPDHQADLDQLRKLSLLAGQGGLQERTWSPWALQHHLDQPRLFTWLEDALDPESTHHQVLEVRS
jgi:hypothetical protein